MSDEEKDMEDTAESAVGKMTGKAKDTGNQAKGAAQNTGKKTQDTAEKAASDIE